MSLVRCILGKFLGVVCHCFPPMQNKINKISVLSYVVYFLITDFMVRMGERRCEHRVLVGKPEGKRPLGRPRRRWEDNIKMDLQEVEGGCGDWMELAQDRDSWRVLVSTLMNFQVP